MNVFVRLMRSKIVASVIGIFFVAMAYQTVRVVYKMYETDSQINALQSQINESIKKREQLFNLQKLLESDFFAEREARVKFGMKKEGEYAVVLSKTEKSRTYASSPQDSKKGSVSDESVKALKKNPTLWWDFFFMKK